MRGKILKTVGASMVLVGLMLLFVVPSVVAPLAVLGNYYNVSMSVGSYPQTIDLNSLEWWSGKYFNMTVSWSQISSLPSGYTLKWLKFTIYESGILKQNYLTSLSGASYAIPVSIRNIYGIGYHTINIKVELMVEGSGGAIDTVGISNVVSASFYVTETPTVTPPPQPTKYALTVSVSPSGAGYVEPSGGTYNEGSVVFLEAISMGNYYFSYWSGDISGTYYKTEVLMDRNKSVAANYALTPPPPPPTNTFSLTVLVLPSDGGRVTKEPDSISYISGTNVFLTALPNTGYRWVGWEGAISGISPSVWITVNSNKAVTARFEPIDNEPTTIPNENQPPQTQDEYENIIETLEAKATLNQYLSFFGIGIVVAGMIVFVVGLRRWGKSPTKRY